MQKYNIDNGQAVADLWETHSFGIDGMTCENCVKIVTKALNRVSGVKDVNVSLDDATATVTFDTTKTDMPALHDALLRAGYHPAKEMAR